jgi:DNA repair protein RecN (Recombination protein N)
MLRALSIRHFVVVDTLDIEFGAGLTVLTGETGAGKSILLDALGLLLGDRFELRQLRAGTERAELAAVFDIAALASVARWLEAAQLDAGDELLLRRVQDVQGRSRAFINGRPATLNQLSELGAQLLDLHGQHAHQALVTAEAQRTLLDEFGGFAPLAHDVAEAWHLWRLAIERRDAASTAAQAFAAECYTLQERERELAELALAPDEWATLEATQRRLANAAELIEATTQAENALVEGDDALARRLARIVQKLTQASANDAALADVVALLAPAAIQLDEAARAVREYRRRLDLDPAELARTEQRLSAIHDAARRHRVRPDALHALSQSIGERLAQLSEATDADALARAADAAGTRYDELAGVLSAKRATAANALGRRVTKAMQDLAMKGGRFDVALEPTPTAASIGRETVAFRIATHPKQPLAPLSRVASGGELSRVALAIHVAASDAGAVPTLVFDEVDAGIGGAVAATVGRMLQTLAARRQVLCVTHLPQVAAHADHHFRVVKRESGEQVTSELTALARAARVDELARMLAGSEVTSKTRAHARELYDQHRRREQK